MACCGRQQHQVIPPSAPYQDGRLPANVGAVTGSGTAPTCETCRGAMRPLHQYTLGATAYTTWLCMNPSCARQKDIAES